MTRSISQRLLLASILLLALLHGSLYASLMPPWGLFDEEQHVHYIQYLAEQQAIPIVGQTPLSPEIIESAFATHRWEHFHWPTPSAPTPEAMGLEGQSYEGYQPPLYYLLFAPLYAVLPGDILTRLYVLRWASVGISLLTLVFAYQIARKLAPQRPLFAYLACVLLAVIPERTASISRVNNDVMLEVFAAALIWVCTQAVLDGLTVRHSRLMGLLLGLSLLCKTSAAVLLAPIAVTLWVNRRESCLARHFGWMAVIAGALSAPWFARNLALYGDLTGFVSFQKITSFAPPVMSWQTLGGALWDLFRHFWLIWWKGARPEGNWLLAGFDILLLFVSLLSLVGIVRAVRIESRENRRAQAVLMYGLAVGTCALAVLGVYFGGSVPVVQGRFFLPVIAPAIILLSWGLWQIPHGKVILSATIMLLVLFSGLSLFGNLLPYHYYWSIFASGRGPEPASLLSIAQRWNLFFLNLLADKPLGLRSVLLWLPPAYILMLGIVGRTIVRLLSAERTKAWKS